MAFKDIWSAFRNTKSVNQKQNGQGKSSSKYEWFKINFNLFFSMIDCGIAWDMLEWPCLI